jgi:hypothetical protein
MAHDDLAHLDEAAVEHLEHHARGLAGGDRSEAAQVGEQDGDVALGEIVARLRRAGGAGDGGEDALELALGVAGQALPRRLRDDVLDPPQSISGMRFLQSSPWKCRKCIP